MKPVLFKIPFTNKELMHFQVNNVPHFYDKLHVHPELQISLIVKSEGTLVAGNYIGKFKPGDLYVIGSNLPHVFKNNERYFQGKNELHAQSATVYPNDQLLKDSILSYKETDEIKKFLKRAQNGLKIEGENKQLAIACIWKLKAATGVTAFITLFELLQLLSESTEVFLLNNQLTSQLHNEKEEKRIQDIFRFTEDESHRPITIGEVAAVANMTTTAFCRYFKLHTHKTYITVLNEVRINHACRLLQKKDASIAEVCHQVGFNNISNFNRTFKKLMKQTPAAYKTSSLH